MAPPSDISGSTDACALPHRQPPYDRAPRPGLTPPNLEHDPVSDGRAVLAEIKASRAAQESRVRRRENLVSRD
ncbi:hypothetical protein GCM10009531_81440 [Actinoplanes capillaceus]